MGTELASEEGSETNKAKRSKQHTIETSDENKVHGLRWERRPFLSRKVFPRPRPPVKKGVQKRGIPPSPPGFGVVDRPRTLMFS